MYVQRILPTTLLIITAITLAVGSGLTPALASSRDHGGGNGGNTVLNITVNCSDGSQVHKHVTGSGNTVANVNVSCTGGGGTVGPQGPPGQKGDPGLPGRNGQNATVTFFTEQNTTTASSK